MEHMYVLYGFTMRPTSYRGTSYSRFTGTGQMRRSVGTLAVPDCGCCRFCAERSAKKSR